MKVERKTHLDRLISRRENGRVKVITGMRRCGKSFLLRKLFVDYLLQDGVNQAHITYANLEDFENKELRDAATLYKYIKSRLHTTAMNYII